jgi:hypothetical protein
MPNSGQKLDLQNTKEKEKCMTDKVESCSKLEMI